jgi:hypothetical protein
MKISTMQIRSILFFMFISFLVFGSRAAKITLGKASEEKPVALMNGVAHLGNGETIENAVITFEDGKITLVADARLVRLDLTRYEVIDIARKHVYPIKNCSKKGNKKCLKVISKTKTNLLTEQEPANLLVLAHELTEGDKTILFIFEKGHPLPTEPFILSNNRLIHE